MSDMGTLIRFINYTGRKAILTLADSKHVAFLHHDPFEQSIIANLLTTFAATFRFFSFT